MAELTENTDIRETVRERYAAAAGRRRRPSGGCGPCRDALLRH